MAFHTNFSRSFHPCNLVRHFHVSHFLLLQSGAANSCLAFSTLAFLTVPYFHVSHFQSPPRDSEWQWHQLDHMQVCTALQTDNHANTPPLSFFTGLIPFLPPNQQRQSTEDNSTEGNISEILSAYLQALRLAYISANTLSLSRASARALSSARPSNGRWKRQLVSTILQQFILLLYRVLRCHAIYVMSVYVYLIFCY